MRSRALVAAAVAVVMALAAAVVPALTAQADTAPPAGTPETVAADALPTVQIDGVAWSQTVVGDWVYVGGSFSTARPAGSAPGQDTVPRQNLLRYDIRTGELDPTWAWSTNAQVRAVAASPDGRRLYVGGDFTSLTDLNTENSTINRYRLAAFDTATGALVTSFNAVLDYQVRAIAATNESVYVGGGFSRANNEPRARVAAFSSSGSLLPWNPSADDYSVSALAISPDRTAVWVGGSFTSFNGSAKPGHGLARVHPTTGATLPLPANSIIYNGGSAGAITGFSGDADNIYAVGYTWGRSGGTLEGTAAIRWSDGELAWVADCHGDSYSVFAHATAVYNASHAHYCGNIGSFGQTDPHADWTYYRGIALSKDATRTVGKEPLGYTNFEGKPGPTVLNFFPDIDWGTYTGQNQGPWSLAGNGQYVLYGGEFRNVNFRPQQGLVRFAVKSVAPNKMGPRFSGSNFPLTVEPVASGAVRLSWQANADPDNEALVYRVIRNSATGTPVHQQTSTSQMWNRPWMGFTDTGLTPGASYTYRVTVTDPFGNAVSSPTVSVTADGTGSLSAYAQEVMRDGASHYWRLGETSGSTAADTAATNDATYGSGVATGRAGAIAGDADRAADLGTGSGGWIQSDQRYLSTNYFSVEAWIRPANNDRGRIVGFGDSNSLGGESSQRDRHLYLDGQGRINFGINPAERRVLTSPESYNDGKWHHVVGTMGADGLRLYVDGTQVASRASWTVAGNYFGYWRIGGDGLAGWPNRPSGDYYGGLIDEVAIYPDALPAATILAHYRLGAGTGSVNEAPVASFTSAVDGMTVSVDGSGSADPDGSIASYTWSFGDGATATGATASHTYAAGGTYSVTLTVTDNEGARATESRQVTITSPNQAPTASFTSSTNGLTVSVDGSGSSDPDGSIASYAWSFGDGGSATGATATHTYASAGTHTVTLTVTDDAGATAKRSAEVSVVAPTDTTVSAKGVHAVNPARLADTRPGRATVDGQVAGTGALGHGGTLRVPVLGRGGVPTAGVGSVVLNVTVTQPVAPGVVTAWPSGTPRPNASNVNFVGGQTVPNLVTVRPGADGAVTLHTTTATHLVVDVQGWSPVDKAIRGVDPARLADTRAGRVTVDGQVSGTGPLAHGGTLQVPVLGRGGVPATGVGAVVLNVTATQPAAPGVVTAWPSGTPRPNASNLNFVGGQTVPNLVTVRPGADGTVSLHSTTATHLVVDVQGWAPQGEELTSVDPARLADTRAGRATVDGQVSGTGPVAPDGTLRIPVLGRGGVPASGVGAVVLNVTVTQPAAPGHVTAWPSGTARPNASNLNYSAGQTVPNLVVVRPGADGAVSLHATAGTHLVVDVQSWSS